MTSSRPPIREEKAPLTLLILSGVEADIVFALPLLQTYTTTSDAPKSEVATDRATISLDVHETISASLLPIMTEPLVSQPDSASKPEPLIVNSSPPMTVKEFLLMLETAGVLPAAIPPFGLVTQVSESYVTSKPVESHSVSEPPMLTVMTCPGVKPVPEAVTTVPPCCEPTVGEYDPTPATEENVAPVYSAEPTSGMTITNE